MVIPTTNIYSLPSSSPEKETLPYSSFNLSRRSVLSQLTSMKQAKVL